MGYVGSTLSALTANILFDGQSIGTLQEITIEEDFNIKAMDQIGSSYNVEYLPGTSTGRLVAKRAMLESDLFFDRLTPGVKASTAITNLVNDVSNGEIDISSSVQTTEGILDFWSNLFGRGTKDKLQFVVYFDIQLLNEKNEIFAQFKDCVLKSRTMSITLGNVIVMQDIVLLFKQRVL